MSVVDSSLSCNTFYDLIIDASSVPCTFICQSETSHPIGTDWSCVNPYYSWYTQLNQNKPKMKRSYRIWMKSVTYLGSVAGETQLCGHLGQRGSIILKVGCVYVNYTLMEIWKYNFMCCSCAAITGWGLRMDLWPVSLVSRQTVRK